MTGGFGTFESMQDGTRRVITVHVREDVPADEAAALVDALDAVSWQRLSHAYGLARDVPALLYAVTVGDTDTRKPAWWELWGDIHHQGTVYEATTPAVPFVAALASTNSHPDRVQALSFLRQVALGDGESAEAVRAAVRPHAVVLVDGLWREPELVKRAVVWLASAFPSLAAEHDALVDLVPERMRATWDEVLEHVRRRGDAGEYDDADDAAFDRQDEFERWALAGWTEPSASGHENG